MMGQIYAQAETVHVWLGEDHGTAQQAIDTASAIERKSDEFAEQGYFDHAMSPPVESMFINDPDIRAIDWQPLTSLMVRSWFQRVWCIQEIAMAKQATVHIGALAFDWMWFSRIVTTVRALRVDIYLCKSDSGVKALFLMHTLNEQQRALFDKQPVQQVSVLRVVEATRAFQSSLSVDKLYGTLSLMPASEASNIQMNYSCSAEESFVNFTATLLTSTRPSFDVLTHCVKPQRTDLPSWGADWTSPGQMEPFRIRGLQCRAAGETKPHAQLDKTRRLLAIDGRIVDSIAEVETMRPIPPSHLDVAPNEDDGADAPLIEFKRRAAQWFRNAGRIASPEGYRTPPMMDCFWRTSLCNRTRENKIPDDHLSDGFDIFFPATLNEITPAAMLEQRRAEVIEQTPEDNDKYQQHIFESMQSFVRRAASRGSGCQRCILQMVPQ